MASSVSFDESTVSSTIGDEDFTRPRGRARSSNPIALHRSLNRLSFRWTDVLRGAGLCFLATAGWLLLLPSVCVVWHGMFQAGLRGLHLNATVISVPYHILGFRIPLPSIDMASFPPDLATWWTTAILCVALLALSFGLPSRFTPMAYLLRLAITIQGSALVYVVLIPARFPHAATDFITSTTIGGAVLILLVPSILSLIYYVFDFPFRQKIFLTALLMMHLAVFVPMQALLQAYILHQSVLFMPVLFLLFGMPLEILVIVSFYSWGMSWMTQTMDGVSD